jgi:hypothetical protein
MAHIERIFPKGCIGDPPKEQPIGCVLGSVSVVHRR